MYQRPSFTDDIKNRTKRCTLQKKGDAHYRKRETDENFKRQKPKITKLRLHGSSLKKRKPKTINMKDHKRPEESGHQPPYDN